MIAIAQATSGTALASTVARTAPRAIFTSVGGNAATILGKILAKNNNSNAGCHRGTYAQDALSLNSPGAKGVGFLWQQKDPFVARSRFGAESSCLSPFTEAFGTPNTLVGNKTCKQQVTILRHLNTATKYALDHPKKAGYRIKSTALDGEDMDDPDESVPLDDRDFDSHHNHHKGESVPLDDRDFMTHHEHQMFDDDAPMDDRDFASVHTKHHHEELSKK